MILRYKNGEIDEDEYAAEYRTRVLDKLGPIEVQANLGSDAVLLCYEAPGEFCHRTLAAKWLEAKLGITIEEVS